MRTPFYILYVTLIKQMEYYAHAVRRCCVVLMLWYAGAAWCSCYGAQVQRGAHAVVRRCCGEIFKDPCGVIQMYYLIQNITFRC